MHTRLGGSPPGERVRTYLVRLFDRVVTERVEDRVGRRLEATVDVLTDPALIEDLRQADAQPDQEARPYDEIRRDLGLA
jgi:hypothetical protein